MNREARCMKPFPCDRNCGTHRTKPLFCSLSCASLHETVVHGMNREARCMKQLFWEIKVGKAPAVYAA